MEWTAPDVIRVDEPVVADERTMLDGWLDWHRATLIHKCTGLTGEQLAERASPPSSLSLLGLIRHQVDVERSWFRRRFRGEDVDPAYFDPDQPDLCFEGADAATADLDYQALVVEWDASRRAVAGASLDETFQHARRGEMSLRWVYVHMIEEYARHNGHADLLREAIDGTTGS